MPIKKILIVDDGEQADDRQDIFKRNKLPLRG